MQVLLLLSYNVQLQFCVPVLTIPAMVPYPCSPILLEKGLDIAVTMGTDYLAIQAELVNSQENGVEHNQHALVSVLHI